MAFVFILFIMLIIAGMFFAYQQAQKRRGELEMLARSLPGFRFDEGKNYSYDERYPFLNKLCQGNDRYAFNILSGPYQEFPVQVFDYHYETSSTDSDGHRKTTHHHFSFFILEFQNDFPELIVSRESWADKFVQFLGFDDIDFESAEFSRKFMVKSTNKKFAYDICHGAMIEYLLENDDLSIEIERNCLTLFFFRRLEASQIVPNLDRLVKLHELFPQYLTNGTN